jgi:hypothetical protein
MLLPDAAKAAGMIDGVATLAQVVARIRNLEKLPNYKSARILGLCLYVMGLRDGKFGIDRDYAALRKAVLKWTRKNYLRLVEVQPDVAASCLVGSLSFDKEGQRICKTYAKGLSLEAPKECLALDAPPMVPDPPAVCPQPSKPWRHSAMDGCGGGARAARGGGATSALRVPMVRM